MSLAMSSTLSTRRKTRGSGHKTLPIALHPTTVRGSSQVESILTMHAKGLERQHPSDHKQPKRRQRPRAKSEAPAAPLPRPWSSASAFSQASLTSADSTLLYPDESALDDAESKRPWSVERRSSSPKRFTSIAVNDQVQVLEAINQRRADNEQSTLIALQSSLAYLRKSVMQSPEMENSQDTLLAALSTLEECSINARGTPTCFAAQYAEQATRDQVIEIEQLQRDLDTANGMVAKLQGENARLETQLSASREDCEEGKIREEKQRQYVHRLRQDLMSSFDDLKLMEANKDHATALAKHRTLELTAVEQKLQQTQNAAQSLKHNLEHTHGKFNDATSELAALRRENEALRAHIENPSENPIPPPVAKTNPSSDDTPEGGQGRHAF